MMTAYEDVKTVITSMKRGAHDVLVKPLDIEMLELIIEKTLDTLRLKREVEALRHGAKKSISATQGEMLFRKGYGTSSGAANDKTYQFSDRMAKWSMGWSQAGQRLRASLPVWT